MIYHDNTVKGTRRGRKWPEDIRTAAMCDLLVHNNLSDVARRYNVPESTLRSWMNQANRKTDREKKSLFEQARETELRALARKASAAANCSVEYMRRRLEQNLNDTQITEYCRRRVDRLRRAGGPAMHGAGGGTGDRAGAPGRAGHAGTADDAP